MGRCLGFVKFGLYLSKRAKCTTVSRDRDIVTQLYVAFIPLSNSPRIRGKRTVSSGRTFVLGRGGAFHLPLTPSIKEGELGSSGRDGVTWSRAAQRPPSDSLRVPEGGCCWLRHQHLVTWRELLRRQFQLSSLMRELDRLARFRKLSLLTGPILQKSLQRR